MLHADDALPGDLAAKNRGLNWNATLNCRGVQHFCATAIKLGGRYHDLIQPNFTLGNKKFSWLYVVECKATHTSNAAGINVLREVEYLQPPPTTCAAEHERARQHFNKADIQYSKTRPADRKQIKKQGAVRRDVALDTSLTGKSSSGVTSTDIPKITNNGVVIMATQGLQGINTRLISVCTAWTRSCNCPCVRALMSLVLVPWRPWVAMITTPLFVILGVNVTLELLLPVNGASGATSRCTAPVHWMCTAVGC